MLSPWKVPRWCRLKSRCRCRRSYLRLGIVIAFLPSTRPLHGHARCGAKSLLGAGSRQRVCDRSPRTVWLLTELRRGLFRALGARAVGALASQPSPTVISPWSPLGPGLRALARPALGGRARRCRCGGRLAAPAMVSAMVSASRRTARLRRFSAIGRRFLPSVLVGRAADHMGRHTSTTGPPAGRRTSTTGPPKASAARHTSMSLGARPSGTARWAGVGRRARCLATDRSDRTWTTGRSSCRFFTTGRAHGH